MPVLALALLASSLLAVAGALVVPALRALWRNVEITLDDLADIFLHI